MKILVIEDELDIREAIVDWLIFEGYDAVSADNGRTGVELARSETPDLIISDINMPELDGFGVLRELQADAATATIPFIFLSARSDRKSVREGMDLGADDYLTKPFTNEELLSAVQSRLMKHSNTAAVYNNTPAPLPQDAYADSTAEPADPTGSLVGKTVKGYQIWDKIGEGGVGTVYKAYQVSIGREVAIKVLRQKYAKNNEFLHRFQTEAELVARLEHPHIVPLYDYWYDADGAYIIMRLVRGGSLRSSLNQEGRWTLAHTDRLLSQVADGLAVAHEVGIIHRDVKPDNILLDERRYAYLTDFGLAKNMITTDSQDHPAQMLDLQTEFFKHDPSSTLYLTDPDQTIGTPAYSSPEQIRTEALTPRSDIYSLGITIHEMLTGRHPFQGSIVDIVLQHLNNTLPPLAPDFADIPPEVDDVLQIATAKRWEDRYDNVLTFAKAFRHAVRRHHG